MRLLTILSALAAAAAFTACSSVQTKVNTGTVKAQTYSMIQPRPGTTTFGEAREVAHQLIQQALRNNLADRQLTEVETDGDITVAYLIIVNDTTVTASVNDYFGYASDADDLAAIAHEKITVQRKDPRYFNAGTLVVDIKDTATGKLLFRSYAVRPLLKDVSDNTRAENVQGAVDEALQALRLSI